MDAPVLLGKTILVTRSAEQSSRLREKLGALGADVIAVPTIRFTIAEDLRPWQTAVGRRRDITHLVFTSANAVEFFFLLSAREGLHPDVWNRCRIAAIGERTAAKIGEFDAPVHFRSTASTGIGFATELVEREGVGPASVVLIPQSAIAHPQVADYIESAGATVHAVPVYETLTEEAGKATPLLEAIDRGSPLDAATFSSPSSLHAFLDMTGDRGRRLLLGESIRLISIGPTTSEAIRGAGFEVGAEARTPDMDALVDAVVEALTSQRES